MLPFTPSRLRSGALTLLAACFVALVALLVVMSGSAFGQAATTPSKGEDTALPSTVTNAANGDAAATDDSGSGGLVRTIVGLLVVIAVIYGVTWILKQVKASGEDDAVGGGLANEATLPLGPGRSVHLVRAGNEYLLLGVTDGGVQPLRSYTEAEARTAGFPIDTEVDELRSLKTDGIHDAPVSLLGRIRDLTVRR